MQVSTPSDVETVFEQQFNAPRTAVFAALTQPGHLLCWLGSAEMALVGCDVDPRVGGRLRYVFQRAGGRQIEVRGAIEAVQSPSLLTYRESYDFSPLQMLVTTTLDEAEGVTTLVQRLQYDSTRDRDEDYDGVSTSSAGAYERLARYLAARSTAQEFWLAKSVRIAATPHSVWRALTDPSHLERWVRARVRTTWRVGDPIAFAFTRDGQVFEDKGVVRSFRPGEVLSYGYWSGASGLADEARNYSLITFRLTPDNPGTVLSLRHDMIATEQMHAHSDRNWDDTLVTIRSIAEEN
jgi:uncharacterized protein YndB with AHSA1/START domain